MYEFNAKQKKILKEMGQTHTGKDLKEILSEMKKSVIDVSNIDPTIPIADLGVHVEARKLVKQFIIALEDAMFQKKSFGRDNELDEYE